MHPEKRPASWTPRRILAAVFFLLFLAGVQILLPASRIPADRAVRFGWHMYAHGPESVIFHVVAADGEETTFTEGRFFARNRPEIRAELWIPEVLCREVPHARRVRIEIEARRVRIEIEDREPGIHRCE